MQRIGLLRPHKSVVRFNSWSPLGGDSVTVAHETYLPRLFPDLFIFPGDAVLSYFDLKTIFKLWYRFSTVLASESRLTTRLGREVHGSTSEAVGDGLLETTVPRIFINTGDAGARYFDANL